MKTLKLELKKNLLILDLPEGAKEEITETLLAINLADGDIKIIREKVKFICKGSELSEEIAESFFDDTVYFNDVIPEDVYIKSFIAEIEAKSFYWLKDNLPFPSSDDINWFKNQRDGDFSERYTRIFEWQEAEARTFTNPHIFEILK